MSTIIPRNSVVCWGVTIDFSQLIMNPRYCNREMSRQLCPGYPMTEVWY